jgi:hypothetical protein
MSLGTNTFYNDCSFNGNVLISDRTSSLTTKGHLNMVYPIHFSASYSGFKSISNVNNNNILAGYEANKSGVARYVTQSMHPYASSITSPYVGWQMATGTSVSGTWFSPVNGIYSIQAVVRWGDADSTNTACFDISCNPSNNGYVSPAISSAFKITTSASIGQQQSYVSGIMRLAANQNVYMIFNPATLPLTIASASLSGVLIGFYNPAFIDTL